MILSYYYQNVPVVPKVDIGAWAGLLFYIEENVMSKPVDGRKGTTVGVTFEPLFYC